MKEIEVDRTSQKWLSAEKVLFLTILIDITGYGIVIPLLPFYAARFQASLGNVPAYQVGFCRGVKRPG